VPGVRRNERTFQALQIRLYFFVCLVLMTLSKGSRRSSLTGTKKGLLDPLERVGSPLTQGVDADVVVTAAGFFRRERAGVTS